MSTFNLFGLQSQFADVGASQDRGPGVIKQWMVCSGGWQPTTTCSLQWVSDIEHQWAHMCNGQKMYIICLMVIRPIMTILIFSYVYILGNTGVYTIIYISIIPHYWIDDPPPIRVHPSLGWGTPAFQEALAVCFDCSLPCLWCDEIISNSFK